MSRDIRCDNCQAYLCSDYCDLEERAAQHYPDCMRALMEERDRLRAALELIAMPARADGTYNRCREACEKIARDALEGK